MRLHLDLTGSGALRDARRIPNTFVQVVTIWGILTALGFLLLLACTFASMVLAVLDSLPGAGGCCTSSCLTAGRLAPTANEGGRDGMEGGGRGYHPGAAQPPPVAPVVDWNLPPPVHMFAQGKETGHYPPPAKMLAQGEEAEHYPLRRYPSSGQMLPPVQLEMPPSQKMLGAPPSQKELSPPAQKEPPPTAQIMVWPQMQPAGDDPSAAQLSVAATAAVDAAQPGVAATAVGAAEQVAPCRVGPPQEPMPPS